MDVMVSKIKIVNFNEFRIVKISVLMVIELESQYVG